MTARPKTPLATRVGYLGTTMLVLSIAGAAYATLQVVGSIFAGGVVRILFGQMKLPAGAKGPAVADFEAFMKAVEEMTATLAAWQAIRYAPVAIASGVAIWIALRVRRAEKGSLSAARIWAWCALGVAALCSAIQAFVVAPMTYSYMEKLGRIMPKVPPGPGSSGFDPELMMSRMALMSGLFGIASTAVGLSIWPVVVQLWARALQREARGGA